VPAAGASPGQRAADRIQLSRYVIARRDPITTPGGGRLAPEPRLYECLELGSRGPQVYQVQLQLVRLGYLTPKEVESSRGVFSEKTCEAMRRFQLNYGLEDSGYVDPETFHAMIQVEIEEYDRKAAEAAAKRRASRPSSP
jgi:peptidoglycan hydrolase-like protein with peptidoglycan-binding domain